LLDQSEQTQIMNFQLKAFDASVIGKASHDALVVLGGAKSPAGSPAWIAAAYSNKDFDGKSGQGVSVYAAAGTAARRAALVGAGDGSAKSVAKAVASGYGAVKHGSVKSLGIVLGADAGAQQIAAAVSAAADASYCFTASKPSAKARALASVTIYAANDAANQEGLRVAAATVEGVEFAKEWANRPGNYATPTLLAKAAQSLAAPRSGISCEVLGPKEVAKLKMGSFMAVAQGSQEPLRFVVLKYTGAGKEAPVVLVGKGITFDTGGISLKPGAEMDEMKFDMGGAASVLGAFKTLSILKPAVNVVGLIAACENMPDGRAVKPGDVVTSMSGQTIEILNTDAEGRLILCDALTYAERFKPKCVVDIATLTGACVIALGHQRTGMYATTDALAKALSDAGDAGMDPCWRMPLDDEYAEGLKSNFADVANIGGRAGGSITAAKFLQRFASKYDWGHLDVAGTAWKSGAAKGSTGRPVPLLTQFVLANAGASPAKKTARK
jgi:leucyl aminopeptidase